MKTDIHHNTGDFGDSSIVTFTGLPANSIPGDITEIEYESALEATRAERARQEREAAWEADPDWQAFQELCYSDTDTPDAAAIRRGVQSPDCGRPTRPCAGTMPPGDGIAPGRRTSGHQAGYWQMQRPGTGKLRRMVIRLRSNH